MNKTKLKKIEETKLNNNHNSNYQYKINQLQNKFNKLRKIYSNKIIVNRILLADINV